MKQRRVMNVTVSCLAVTPEGSKVNSKSVAATEILPTQSLIKQMFNHKSFRKHKKYI